jgi:hypothetical protein
MTEGGLRSALHSLLYRRADPAKEDKGGIWIWCVSMRQGVSWIVLLERGWYKAYCGDTKDEGVKTSVVRARLFV